MQRRKMAAGLKSTRARPLKSAHPNLSQVIQPPHADQLQRIAQLPGDVAIRRGRLAARRAGSIPASGTIQNHLFTRKDP